MNIGDINTKISSLTGADTGSYTSAQRAVDINIWNEKVVGIILDSQDESDYDDPNHGDFAIVTTSLVAGQRDYSIPVAEYVLNLKRLDVCYDGTNPYRANPVDSSEIPQGLGNDSQIDGYYDKAAPVYDIVSNSILLYPRADATDVANGGYIRAFWSRAPKAITTSDITTGTYIPGFDSTFHAMLAYGPAYEYAVAKQMPQAREYQAVLADFEARLRRQYGAKQKDRTLRLISDYIDYE